MPTERLPIDGLLDMDIAAAEAKVIVCKRRLDDAERDHYSARLKLARLQEEKNRGNTAEL